MAYVVSFGQLKMGGGKHGPVCISSHSDRRTAVLICLHLACGHCSFVRRVVKLSSIVRTVEYGRYVIALLYGEAKPYELALVRTK